LWTTRYDECWELKFRLGLFEHAYADLEYAKRVVHSEEHQQLALRSAREGIVLLKNDNHLLPLKKDLKSIKVIGPNADSSSTLFGDYAPSVVLQHVQIIFDGIKGKVSSGSRVVYAKGCGVNDEDKSAFPEAVQAARNADVAILVAGEEARRKGPSNRPAATDGEDWRLPTPPGNTRIASSFGRCSRC
jgi:beta-glucosidase